MPASKAQQKAVSKYMKENYDVYQIRMKKGRKDEIKAHAEAQGQSVNGFINAAIDHEMGKPSVSHVEAPNLNDVAGVVSLPFDTLKAAQKAAEAVGEATPQFIARAVETQAKRDRSSLALGINPATGDKLEKEA